MAGCLSCPAVGRRMGADRSDLLDLARDQQGTRFRDVAYRPFSPAWLSGWDDSRPADVPDDGRSRGQAESLGLDDWSPDQESW